MARAGNNPKRRIAAAEEHSREALQAMAQELNYIGSANHKRFPGDYGFQPPVNPRPWKSLCDKDRIILRGEARRLFTTGVLKGLVSSHAERPKYVWSVDQNGSVYEAKADQDGYHGYRLENDDPMAVIVRAVWASR